jgi:hypothetical protein
MMLTIVWNSLGFHLLDAFPNGRTFDAKYYRGNIFTALIPICSRVDGRKLVIHPNNAKSHTVRKF